MHLRLEYLMNLLHLLHCKYELLTLNCSVSSSCVRSDIKTKTIQHLQEIISITAEINHINLYNYKYKLQEYILISLTIIIYFDIILCL